jgi:branched-chain amino acid transport system ATP-binding protein
MARVAMGAVTNDVLLRTEQLTRSFGSLMAVSRVNLTVRRGELRSIIGPNGAGKTTLFRLVSGEMAPSSGRVWFAGTDITGLPQHRVCRLGIAKSYQITNIFPHLSVVENVRVAVQGYRHAFDFWSRADRLADCRERALAILASVGLARKAGHPAAHLSHGEKRHLEIGIALASDPQLLLLDEPTAGMSPEETEETVELIRELATGRTVVLVEHKMKLVMRISDHITVLHQGQVLAEGTPPEIRGNEAVRRTYLGVSR